MSDEERGASPIAIAEAFDESYPRALAIYCSDGRFTNIVEGLLRVLGHDRLDTLTMPGGPALFNPWLSGMSHSMAIEESARFLIESHGIAHVFLLAHDGCGFYRKHCHRMDPAALRGQQEADLRLAAQTILRTQSAVDVRLYRGVVDGQRISFAPVTLSVVGQKTRSSLSRSG